MVAKLSFANHLAQYLPFCEWSKLRGLAPQCHLLLLDHRSAACPSKGTESLPPFHPSSTQLMICVLKHFSKEAWKKAQIMSILS
jgi:hypothetical protein